MKIYKDTFLVIVSPNVKIILVKNKDGNQTKYAERFDIIILKSIDEKTSYVNPYWYFSWIIPEIKIRINDLGYIIKNIKMEHSVISVKPF